MSRSELPIVFGVGLNKTGTSSLGVACELLGYRPLHHETSRLKSAPLTELVRETVAKGERPFSRLPELRKFNAFFDMRCVERYFPAFDEAYPGAKFILHTRDLEPWLNSRQKHVERAVARGSKTWTIVDRAAWRDEYVQHHARVHEYFKDRPEDLLVIDIVKDPGWQPLCSFLGLPQPTREFPFENAASKTFSRKVTLRAQKYLRRVGIR